MSSLLARLLYFSDLKIVEIVEGNTLLSLGPTFTDSES